MCSILMSLGDSDGARMKGLLALHHLGAPLPTTVSLGKSQRTLFGKVTKPLKSLLPSCLKDQKVTLHKHAFTSYMLALVHASELGAHWVWLHEQYKHH